MKSVFTARFCARLIALASCLVLSSFVAADDARQEAAKPNVLLIAVDDLRPELGCYGTRAVSPNIDRFASTGLQFDRAYCNQAVCGASRISLMTGLYPEFTGERTYHVTGWRKRWADVVTLNQHFKENGYTTIGLGKVYHNSKGPGVDPENWTEWITVGGKEYGTPARLRQVRERNGRRRGPATEAADRPDGSHADGNRAKVGAARIYDLAKADKPFFLAVGFTKPHLPFVAPRTIVVLWADHGWKLGDHTSWCKHTNFECDTRVPLIIRHPNMAFATGRTDALVELIDLYPTLCDLCGLEKPAHLQGKSVLPVFKNTASVHREFAYSSYPHGRGQGKTAVTGHSIRTERFRYTEWWERGSDKVIDSVLTNIEADPTETTSVTDDPELLQDLSRKLRRRVLRVRK